MKHVSVYIYIYIHIHILHFINIIISLKNLQRANSCSKPVITIVQKLSWSSTCVTIFEFVSFGFVSSCFYLQDFYKAFYKKSKEKSPITSGQSSHQRCPRSSGFMSATLLTLSWRKPLSYRNHLLCKSMDWFLYDKDSKCPEKFGIVPKSRFLKFCPESPKFH